MQDFWLSYGDSMTQALGQVSPRHGAHLTNCATHCQSGSLSNPAQPGVYAADAVMAWYPRAITDGQNNASWVRRASCCCFCCCSCLFVARGDTT